MPSTYPFVSVVVPVYNGGATIAQCIESLLAQDYPRDRYEIVVVDNNSTDETPMLVRAYPVLLAFERCCQTSYAARNKGITKARGEIVAFTDADCLAEKTWLAELVRPFNTRKVGAVTGRVLAAEPETDLEAFMVATELFHGRRGPSAFPVLWTNNAAVRRDLLIHIGMFNSAAYTAGDVDLGWRIHLDTEYEITYAARAVVRHKHRSSVRGMYAQSMRHGFGEILLDTMHRHRAGYFRPPKVQLHRMAAQTLACLNYVRAFAFRTVERVLGRDAASAQTRAFYLLVRESANLMGKLRGLWVTCFFTRDPRGLLLEDPGEPR